MSIGNTKDQGNKGNNFPYQLRTLQLLSSINDGIAALPGVDYETRTSTYQAICTICGPGYSTGDIIVRYDIIDVATQTLAAEMWFNQTTQGVISPAPAPGDLTPISAPSGVTVLNGPLGAAVNIQDGGNSITVDGIVAATQSGTWNITNITGTVSLPTGAATEATLATKASETTVASIDTRLTPQVRTHNTISTTTSGTVSAGSIRGSVINAGNAAGSWNGISLPAGVSIPWDAVGNRDTYGAISYDATGTTFIIEYTT